MLLNKKEASLIQICLISIGFMGIQFGWGLQMANMSAIYQMLGAKENEIALLWIAAPLTGLFVQPIIGYMSDRTWTRFGRRKPYFFVGAILCSVALVAMPNSNSVMMAACLLWLLDGAINATMQPFRAFVADMLPPSQIAKGFTVQTILIGIGAIVSSSLIWILVNWGGVSNVITQNKMIPPAVEYAFYIGAFVLLLCVCITVFTVKEYPPSEEELVKLKSTKESKLSFISEITILFLNMPALMKKMALVQIASWGPLFILWTYYTPFIAKHIFNHQDIGTNAKQQAVEWTGICFSVYNVVALLMAFLFVFMLKKISAGKIHAVSLLIGGLSLLTLPMFDDKIYLIFNMIGIGIAWAAILSMPYAIISNSIPSERMGAYMGLFNIFIVLPQVLVALLSGLVVKNIFNGDLSYMMILGGVSFLLASLLMIRCIKEIGDEQSSQSISVMRLPTK
jgi:maltose/moltooligosaccharide transporter